MLPVNSATEDSYDSGNSSSISLPRTPDPGSPEIPFPRILLHKRDRVLRQLLFQICIISGDQDHLRCGERVILMNQLCSKSVLDFFQ